MLAASTVAVVVATLFIEAAASALVVRLRLALRVVGEGESSWGSLSGRVACGSSSGPSSSTSILPAWLDRPPVVRRGVRAWVAEAVVGPVTVFFVVDVAIAAAAVVVVPAAFFRPACKAS